VTQGLLAITGGTGFVGSNLINRARASGWHVRALTRSPQPVRDGITWVQGALDDARSLRELTQGTDAVIHVAGVVNVPDRAAFEFGNAAGTLAVVEAARATGVERFVHVSSLAAREPDLSNYGWSKAKAETIVAASGLDWTMIRPPTIYGPGDKDLLDLFKMAQNGIVTLPPAGRQSVIEVGDLARLLLAVIPAGETRGQIYEADDGAENGWSHESFGKAIGWALDKRVTTLSMPRPVMALAARIDRLLRRDRAKLTADRVSYMCHPNWVIDPSKRPPVHIWQPQIATRTGFKATAAAYRAAGWL
jgi:uncharacterized protein YbjT (DUF2867 family)